LISSGPARELRNFVSEVRQFRQTDNTKIGARDLPSAVD